MSIHHLRICLITGSYPPQRCGVGDYAAQLAVTLAAHGHEVHVFTSKGAGPGGGGEIVHDVVPPWTPLKMTGLLRTIKSLRPDIVHMQYPTNGYGYRVGPQALVMLCRLAGMRVITTSHEFIRARFPRKASLVPLFLFSHALIFTSGEERAAIGKAMPWFGNKLDRSSAIIPVGTNIPVEASPAQRPADSRTVSFFGLFFPGRMIELVIDAFRDVSRRMPDVRFRLIGDVHPLHKDYFGKIREYASRELPEGRFEWFTGRTPGEISRALSASAVCLLPYPDGATFRRTTLIAALALGVPVVTTRSDLTPKMLIEEQPVLFGNDQRQFAEQVVQVLSDPALAARLSGQALKIAGLFSWDRIVNEHGAVYRNVMHPGSSA